MACMVLSGLAAWEMSLQNSGVNVSWSLPDSNLYTVNFSWELPYSTKQNLTTSRGKQPSSDWRNTAIRLAQITTFPKKLLNHWNWRVFLWLGLTQKISATQDGFLGAERDTALPSWLDPTGHVQFHFQPVKSEQAPKPHLPGHCSMCDTSGCPWMGLPLHFIRLLF